MEDNSLVAEDGSLAAQKADSLAAQKADSLAAEEAEGLAADKADSLAVERERAWRSWSTSLLRGCD